MPCRLEVVGAPFAVTVSRHIVDRADARVLTHDWPTAWSLLRAAPDGEATPDEARDPRTAAKAALAAAATGRADLARQLAADANPFEAAWIDASLAEAEAADDDNYDADALRSAWETVWAAAANDEQRLVAARGLLLAGGSAEGVEALRQRRAEAMREVDQLAEALHVGPGLDQNASIARLRQLRQDNKFAAARLAELLYAKDRVKESAAVLREAADRFDDQHLRLMAATQFAEAGLLSDAADEATLALARATPRWPGRQRAHRICLQAAAESADWPQTIAHARQLLAVSEDPEARWVLAYALVSEQQPDEAWEVINRPGGVLPADSKQWAALRLDLLNRYGTRQQVFQDAVSALQRYGTDEQFAAVWPAHTPDASGKPGTRRAASWRPPSKRLPSLGRSWLSCIA